MLHMIRIGASQVYHDPLAAGFNDVQELSKTHDAVSRAKTEVLHRILTHYLPLYFPEVDRFRHNSRSDWFFAFLDRFPTPASITALSKEAFIAAAWDVVGRKVAKAQLLGDIYETARSSIGLPVPPDAPAVSMFRLVIGEVRGLIQQRDAIEATADARSTATTSRTYVGTPGGRMSRMAARTSSASAASTPGRTMGPAAAANPARAAQISQASDRAASKPVAGGRAHGPGCIITREARAAC